MNQYKIPPFHPDHEAFFGADPPMTTFFAQMFDRSVKDPDEQIIVWIGDENRAIPRWDS